MARRWRADWRLLLFAGLFLPLLLGLGVWQLERAEQKARLLADWQEESSHQPWSRLTDEHQRPGQPVTVTGHYGEQTWLLDNRTRNGRAGYEVLTVFQPTQGQPLVVNRGWLPAPPTRNRLPEVTTPEQLVTLTGRLAAYPQPPVLSDQAERSEGWPRRVQALPPERVAEQLAQPPLYIVQLYSRRQPGALEPARAPDIMGPQTHYGYAAQWFGLALVLIILTLVASYRKTTGADNDNDNG